MDYNNRTFRVISNSENGETSEETLFEYKQTENRLTCVYGGGQIVEGHLMGLVDEDGNIQMSYHQINTKGELMTGTCFSRPEKMDSGKIRLQETWQWTSGDRSKGTSTLEEV